MLDEIKATDLVVDYYRQWMSVYKEGAIRDVTFAKYRMTLKWLQKLIPIVRLCDLSRIVYQQLINVMQYIMRDRQLWIFTIN